MLARALPDGVASIYMASRVDKLAGNRSTTGVEVDAGEVPLVVAGIVGVIDLTGYYK
jgi:hypothetical protein